MDHCPTADQLRRFLADELSASEASAVEAHLEECASCQQTLDQLTAATLSGADADGKCGSDSTFLRQLQHQPPNGTWPAVAQKDGEAGPTPATPATLIVRRSTPSITELQTLLRKRLLFFAVVSCILYAVYAVSAVYLWSDVFNLSMYAIMLALTGVLIWLLRSRPLLLRQLRWVETILFFSTALFFTRLQWNFFWWDWLSKVANDDWIALMLSARGMSLNWFILIAAYGLMIPNTWRRCAVVVTAMALWPVLLNGALAFHDRPLATRLTFVAESAMNMAIAAAFAIYGSHRIEVLRQQAEARKVGPYQLKQRLGAGGMGEVYLAEHVLLRRPCAVKLIRPERAGDPHFLRRFEREVQVMATLTHPNTVEIYDYGHAVDGAFYYAMEYLPGLDLEQLVRLHGPLPPGRAAHLLRQVCSALGEAHAIGLIHRDIKPSNIIACERGGRHDVAKLLDFGLVRGAAPPHSGDTLTQMGTLAGTPAYMSPEQAGGKVRLDARSDLYSLGAVAYFLVTGQPPFIRQTAIQTLAAHLDAPVAPPGRICTLPADLEAVILRCLEKDRSQRFSDAKDLERALAHCSCTSGWSPTEAAPR